MAKRGIRYNKKNVKRKFGDDVFFYKYKGVWSFWQRPQLNLPSRDHAIKSFDRYVPITKYSIKYKNKYLNKEVK